MPGAAAVEGPRLVEADRLEGRYPLPLAPAVLTHLALDRRLFRQVDIAFLRYVHVLPFREQPVAAGWARHGCAALVSFDELRVYGGLALDGGGADAHR